MAVATISLNFANQTDLLAGSNTFKSINPATLKAALQNGSLYGLNGTAANFSNTLQANTFVGVYPPGTRLLFAQAAAPAGWTTVTSSTHNDATLRVVNSVGGGTSGAINFTTAFTSQAFPGTVGNYTLTINDLPSHSHSATVNAMIGNGGSVRTSPSCGDGCGENGFDNTTLGVSFGAAGDSGAHGHSFTGSALNLAVKYVNIIVASKD